jgi:hypothetical protein
VINKYGSWVADIQLPGPCKSFYFRDVKFVKNEIVAAVKFTFFFNACTPSGDDASRA